MRNESFNREEWSAQESLVVHGTMASKQASPLHAIDKSIPGSLHQLSTFAHTSNCIHIFIQWTSEEQGKRKQNWNLVRERSYVCFALGT